MKRMNNEMMSITPELDRIHKLYKSRSRLSVKLDYLQNEWIDEKFEKAEEAEYDFKGIQSHESKNLPKKPVHSFDANPFVNSLSDAYAISAAKKGAVIGLGALVAVVLFLIASICKAGAVMIGWITIAGAVGWFVWGRHQIDTYYDHLDSVRRFHEFSTVAETENARFYAACVEYDNAFLKYVQICDEKSSSITDKYLTECAEIDKKYSEEKEGLESDLKDINGQLDKVTLLHPDVFYLAGDISSLLKTGRADTLKEAINLAVAEKRRDEEEQARREEAEEQARILEERNREIERHNAEMARVTREHNAAMEKKAEEEARIHAQMAEDARAHNAAMERQARNQARQQTEQNRFNSNDLSRCSSCKNYNNGCRGGIHNCGAYVSKRV